MRAAALTGPGPLWVVGVLLLCGCEALWGPFREGNEQNCQKNGALCTERQVCNPATKQCEDRCQSSRECTADEGRPLCLNGACVPCDMIADVAAANGQCLMRGVMGSERCVRSGPNKGRCLGCDSPADCSDDSFVCNAKNQCALEPCTGHAACKSGVCDPYQEVGGKPGRCVPSRDLVYVSNGPGCDTMADEMDDGLSPDKALCSLAEGVRHAIKLRRKGVRVLGSGAPYGSFSVGDVGMRFGGALTVYGPAGQGVQGEGPKAQVGGDSNKDGVTAYLTGSASVAIDGIEVNGAKSGVVCDADRDTAGFALRRSQVVGSYEAGVSMSRCSLAMDRVQISGSGDRALVLSGSKGYAVTNCFIVGNTATRGSPIRIGDNSTGRFQFNTVAGNSAPMMIAGGIDCGTDLCRLEDSIFFGNSVIDKNDNMTQFFGDMLQVERVVIGADMMPGLEGAIRLDPAFVGGGDYRLKADDAKNAACCIDKGSQSPSVRTDYFGAPRPQGGGADIGAHEAR